MIIKKVEFFLVGEPTEKKTRITVFWSSNHFSASQHPWTPPKLQKKCIWVFHNIPPSYAKILTAKFYSWRKWKNPLGGWANF